MLRTHHLLATALGEAAGARARVPFTMGFDPAVSAAAVWTVDFHSIISVEAPLA